MTDRPPAPDARPSPGAALEAAFGAILRQQMHDMPIVNPALAVEAVGFRRWNAHWLGILITPWFMNLLLVPRTAEHYEPIVAGKSRHYGFPAGVFEFIGARDPTLGDYQACSLFSPMFEFADPASARATAVAALAALFDAAHRRPAEGTEAQPAAVGAGPTRRELSKRELLFGFPPRADRGP
jgi:[NiFe] hydrogenase assembly HybE family chaperone